MAVALLILRFLFVLGVLVFVHELGHFLVARFYGVRVLTFSLGFGPKILRFKRGATEYCVSALPLGGYVKMAGETVQDEREGAPDEFLSKSRWVRFQVYLAGPAMNVLLAIVALTVVLSGGADVPRWVSSPPVVGVVSENGAAAKVGIQVGDRIVSVNGRETPTWDVLQMAVLPKANQSITLVLDRNGERLTKEVTPGSETKYEMGTLGIGPVQRAQIIAVRSGKPAEKAGLRRGDVLLSVGGKTGLNRDQTIATIRNNGPKPIELVVERDGQPLTFTITPEGDEGSSIIGFDFMSAEFDRIDPTLSEAFRMSLRQNWDTSKQIGATLKGLITRETPVKQLMGPLAIADLSNSYAELGWRELLGFMALISLNLALLNLMPVPILDGGQIAILAIEGITRRDISLKIRERIAVVGAALILALMVTVIYNDIARLMR